jgi:hypothetical protein
MYTSTILMESIHMSKFSVGSKVQVGPNLRSTSVSDLNEAPWSGKVTGVMITPTAQGTITAYDVTPDRPGKFGGRNVLEERLTRG